MKVCLYLIVISFLFSCEPPREQNIPKHSPKQSLVNQVRRKAFDQLKKEKGLLPFGTGAEMMYQINMIALIFHYDKEIDIDEARSLLIDSEKVLVDIVNSNEEIVPYLKNYPFNPQNVEIVIHLRKPDGSKISQGKLCTTSMRRGVLKYKIDSPDGYTLQTIHEETYDEAILNSKSASKLKGSAV